jgi:hypothetical protein
MGLNGSCCRLWATPPPSSRPCMCETMASAWLSHNSLCACVNERK